MDIHKHIKEPTTETYYCDALKRIPASPESDTLDADITVTQAQNQAREFAKAIVYSCFKHFDTSRPAEEFVQ